MNVRPLLPVSLLVLATGCASHGAPERADYYETLFQGQRALQGDAAAFDRLGELAARWQERSSPGRLARLLPGCQGDPGRAAQLAGGAGLIVEARDAVLSQRELAEVMRNALKDVESEYDAIAAMLVEEDASLPELALANDQKFLARAISGTLTQMIQADMGDAVVAADVFGRDVGRFQHFLEASLNGDEELGIEPPSNPDVEGSLGQIEELFTGYVADSQEDVLENVVVQYEAWLALNSLVALAPAGDAGKKAAPAGGDAPAGDEGASGGEDAGAAGAEDDAAADEAAADGAAVDDAASDGELPADADGDAAGEVVEDEVPADAGAEDGGDAADAGG